MRWRAPEDPEPAGGCAGHHPGLFSVRIDDVAASRLAVNHLLDLGHRRITAAGAKQSAILNAEGQRQAQVLLAERQAKAIGIVFSAIHDARPARPVGVPVPTGPAQDR